MLLRFTKMHGLGNDFMVIDLITQHVQLSPRLIRLWSDRYTGVGFDQLLVVEPPRSPEADFRYRIFNADGSEVEQCGNGARCFARFVHDTGLTSKTTIRVQTLAGVIEPQLRADGRVTVDMGPPVLEAARVPFNTDGLKPRHLHHAELWPLALADYPVEVAVVSMGNPHAVRRVDTVERAPVDEQGPQIESHERFPQRVNAGFLEVVNRRHVKLRVYERGAGETLACGTGACAAVVAGVRAGVLDADAEVRVDMRGGELSIRWAGPGQHVFMTGPAVKVFDGEIDLPDTPTL